MQWRRRHCYIYIIYLLCLLSLGVLLVLVQPDLSDLSWLRYPLVHRGEYHTVQTELNIGQRSGSGLVIIPQTTVANMSSKKREVAPTTQGKPSVVLEGEHSRNMTPGPYPYTINEPDKCTKHTNAPFLVLLITVEAQQVEARNAIRQTWGNERVAPALGVIRLFLLGKNDGELGLVQQKMLEAERRRHHDIIQQDFRDTYNNLTIKTLMGMNWVAMHCPQASYVMKTDSDMFVNTEYLINKLLRPEMKPKMNYFTGLILKDAEPFRNKESKWYISPELYPGDRYPPFCSGTGYVLSGDLVTKIYHTSLSIPFIHLEDVYVGLCLAKIGIEPTPPPSEYLFNNYRVSYSSCKYSNLITSHWIVPKEMISYWKDLQNNKQNPCSLKLVQ